MLLRFLTYENRINSRLIESCKTITSCTTQFHTFLLPLWSFCRFDYVISGDRNIHSSFIQSIRASTITNEYFLRFDQNPLSKLREIKKKQSWNFRSKRNKILFPDVDDDAVITGLNMTNYICMYLTAKHNKFLCAGFLRCLLIYDCWYINLLSKFDYVSYPSTIFIFLSISMILYVCCFRLCS